MFMSFLLTLNIFHTYSSVSIAHFEHAISDWVALVASKPIAILWNENCIDTCNRVSTVSSNFLGGAGFSKNEKPLCSLGTWGRYKSSPVGSRGEAPEHFGYFAFWIAQNMAVVTLQQRAHCGTSAWTVICLFLDEFLHFWEFGAWVWDPKPVYRLQNSSGYGTACLSYLNQDYLINVLLYYILTLESWQILKNQWHWHLLFVQFNMSS